MHNHLGPPEGSRTHLLISMFLLNVHIEPEYILNNTKHTPTTKNHHLMSHKVTTLLTSMLV